MAKTARATIVPFWYNMNGTTEELRDAEEKLGKIPGEFGEPEEDDTPFEVRIKPLTGVEQLEISDYFQVNKTIGTVDYTAEGRIKAIKMGLVDWRNFNSHEGAPIPFSIANALEYLDRDDLKLISYQIMIHSIVTEDVRKK